MIREFSLKNNLGKILNLNDLDLFAYSPQGLGVSFSNEYIGANATFIPSSSGVNQNTLNLKILFSAISQKSYQEFYKFSEFLSHQPLTLIYKTSVGVYSRVCMLSEMTKTEISSLNTIDESLNLEFITPWFYYKESQNSPYTDQPGDGKIYRKAGDTPSSNNLFPDPVILGIDRSQVISNWTTDGNIGAWYIETDTRFKEGMNVAIINQTNILNGEFNIFSGILNAKNINRTGQIAGDVLLLDFNFKSDNIQDDLNDLSVEGYSLGGDLISPYKIVDKYGRISENDTSEYYLDSSHSGEWLHFQIAYRPENEDEIIDHFRFIFNQKTSEANYFTSPKLLDLRIENPENTDCYYIYSYVYEETEFEFKPGYYPIINNSTYFGTSSGSPIEITIEATDDEVENPSWELYQGSKVIASDRYLLTIPPKYKLIVSSFPEDQFVRLVAPDGVMSNVYAFQDLTKTNFITIPIGVTILVFDTQDAKISFKMREEKLLV